MITVYLDQWVWIELARAYLGRPTSDKIKRALPQIIAASESDKVVFPLSLITFIESMTRGNVQSRHEVVEFLVKISKGYTISTYINIRRGEIQRALIRRLGVPVHDIEVVNRGIPNLLGGIKEVKGNIPEEMKKKLIEEVEKPQWTLFTFKDQGLSDGIREKRRDLSNHVKILERLRANDSQVTNRTERYYGTMNRFFILNINKELARFAAKLNLPKDVLKFSGREDIEGFFKTMPSLYTIFNLTFARDLEKTRRISPTDSNDIHALGVAIPYCDIVITEAFWVKNAKQQKLDKTYGTTLLSRVDELDALI